MRTDKTRITAVRIRELRKENGISQQKFADAVGVTKMTVVFWECGHCSSIKFNLDDRGSVRMFGRMADREGQDKGRRKGMKTRDMIVIDGAKAKEDIRGFCKRNGVTASGAAKRRGTLSALKAFGNGRRAFNVRFPEELCGFGYVCMKEDAYRQLCETYMLDSGRYIIAQKKQSDDTTPEETKATAETPSTISDDLRDILNQIISMQQEQNVILMQMLEAWVK